MEMEEKYNPNSRKRRRRRRSTRNSKRLRRRRSTFNPTLNSWSDLPVDLVKSVLERLGFVDFQRAKTVCSSWHSASRQCVPKNNHIPWLILFPDDKTKIIKNKTIKNDYCCRLLNPEEKYKIYKTQGLGLEFARSISMKTYGSWLLMRDPLYNLYIVNLFTQERINLPPMERTKDGVFCIKSLDGRENEGTSIRSPVFWIDEKTKDHFVFWGLPRCCVVYSKKGDTSWNQIPETSGCCNMVYKDHKLYFLGSSGYFKIFDFSGEIPQQTFQSSVKVGIFRLGDSCDAAGRKIVVTVTGEVLIVDKIGWRWWHHHEFSRTYTFRVVKVYSSGFLEKHELIHSLGDESMIWDQGITVLANDTDGFVRNSIYFSDEYRYNPNDIFLFNLETQKSELLHKFDYSSVEFSRTRRFSLRFSLMEHKPKRL